MNSKELDTDGMVWVPGGTFAMGSLDFYPEEGPIHDSTVDGMWVDLAPVGNAEFAAFVADARAYAVWAGKKLPTEAEWEHFARDGLQGAVYAWGDVERLDDELMANTWQGHFPYENTGARGWVGTSPVGSFPSNDHGLFDVTGNVWEWTADPWSSSHESPAAPCCAPPSAVSGEGPRRVLKGGSHLCSPEYCLRYRPAARSPESEDSSTTHIGFRCIRR